MNVVDSCGWIEYFAGGPNAEFFATPLQDAPSLLVPTICIYEVFRIMASRRGEKEAKQATTSMMRAQVVDLDSKLATGAALLGIERNLPLADSIIYATAQAHGAVLWTQDEHFEGIEGVRFRRMG